jgi:hypothetical protein
MNYSLKRIWLTLDPVAILLEYEEQSNAENLSQDGALK